MYTVNITKGMHTKNREDIIKSATVSNIHEVYSVVNKYINELDFKSYYYQTTMFKEDLTLTLDFGSHLIFIDIICDSSTEFDLLACNKSTAGNELC